MPNLERRADYYVGHFEAMACNCEVLIDTDDEKLAQEITQCASAEVRRIEQKYSRYRDDNLLHHINRGDAIEVDEETARLLDYAQQLYQLSEGRFDITSGVLRRVWHFDGSSNIPSASKIDALLPKIGWQKVRWNTPKIELPPGMEIDFGGIGKEYAADRAAQIITSLIAEQPLQNQRDISALINLGGDLAITGPRKNAEGWRIGFDNSQLSSPTTTNDSADKYFALKKGGVATSGDANRYLQKDGKHYSHVLDPRSGWPVADAPRAVTVVAATCTDAGMLSTLALLHGAHAEEFLIEQDVPYWCQW